ncbi:MAG: response regulator [Lachnospiraceae bacterium]|nr:response regulator [Lachnospiraceae bacterium]
MTQAQLAEKLGVTDKAVSKWERDLSYPDITLFPRLADVLGVTANDLLNECIDEGQVPRLLQIFGMSHDIRTPLHIILSCASMAQIHKDDQEQLMRYLESIRISGEYLLNTIDLLMQMTYRDQKDITRLRHPATAEELGEYLNERAAARKNALQGYDFKGKRILVAEDIRINQEIAAEILKQTGADVEFADDGQMCFDKIASAAPGDYDLVLMDLKMPNVSGAEATRMIRQLPDPEKAKIPVIAVSADVYEKDRSAALEAGMDGFVEKPIFIDRLLRTMRQFLV